MTFTESIIEQAALDWFAGLEYQVAFGPDLAADGKTPERQDYLEVILSGNALRRGIIILEANMDPNQLLMSKREDILRIAANNGAYNVRVFGSVARGEARPDSDIDFLVNLESGRSLLDLARFMRNLEALLNCPVDVVTEAGLRPRLRPQVLKDARPL